MTDGRNDCPIGPVRRGEQSGSTRRPSFSSKKPEEEAARRRSFKRTEEEEERLLEQTTNDTPSRVRVKKAENFPNRLKLSAGRERNLPERREGRKREGRTTKEPSSTAKPS
jgi:hypothetical protein